MIPEMVFERIHKRLMLLGQIAQLAQHCIGIGIAEVSFESVQAFLMLREEILKHVSRQNLTLERKKIHEN